MINKRAVYELIAILGVAAIALAAPLYFFPTSELNQDTFYHLSIANHYLYSFDGVWRDSITVGPFISVLLASLKLLFSYFIDWKSDFDIPLVKAVVFCCYFMVGIAINFLHKKIEFNKKIIIIAALLYFIPVKTDFLSLNGELLSVVIIIFIALFLNKKNNSIFIYIIVSILCTLAIYTKLQSILIVTFIIFLYCKKDYKRSIIIFSLFLFLFVITELILYSKNIGIFYNYNMLSSYIKSQNLNYSIKIDINTIYNIFLFYLNHIHWVIYSCIVFFPLLILQVIGNRYNDLIYFYGFLLITIITIAIPKRGFEHYIIYLIPFLIFYADRVSLGSGAQLHKFFLLTIYSIIASFSLLNTFGVFSNPVIRAYNGYQTNAELDVFKRLYEKSPGKLFVIGWDYSLYTMLGTYSPRYDTVFISVNFINEEKYINEFISGNYLYVADVTEYSGYLKDKFWSTRNNKALLSAIISTYYEKILDENGLLVFRRKDQFKSLANNFSYNKKSIDYKYTTVNGLSCMNCIPQEVLASTDNMNKRFLGTYASNGDKNIGSFNLNAVVDSNKLYELEYITGPIVDSQKVTVQNNCADGEFYKYDIDLRMGTPHSINKILLSNYCRPISINLTFSDSGSNWGEWIGFSSINVYYDK